MFLSFSSRLSALILVVALVFSAEARAQDTIHRNNALLVDQEPAAPRTLTTVEKAHMITQQYNDALDLTAKQRRQFERYTYKHLCQQEEALTRVLGSARALRRAERHYAADLSHVLRSSQLATFFWMRTREPLALLDGVATLARH